MLPDMDGIRPSTASAARLRRGRSELARRVTWAVVNVAMLLLLAAGIWQTWASDRLLGPVLLGVATLTLALNLTNLPPRGDTPDDRRAMGRSRTPTGNQ
jgi:hypothetical protein